MQGKVHTKLTSKNQFLHLLSVCLFVPLNLWNDWIDFDGTFTDRQLMM